MSGTELVVLVAAIVAILLFAVVSDREWKSIRRRFGAPRQGNREK
jgi:hypothetical protein